MTEAQQEYAAGSVGENRRWNLKESKFGLPTPSLRRITQKAFYPTHRKNQHLHVIWGPGKSFGNFYAFVCFVWLYWKGSPGTQAMPMDFIDTGDWPTFCLIAIEISALGQKR